jgi:CheY-like chemotaxis protein
VTSVAQREPELRPAPVRSSAGIHGRRILYVDDEPLLRRATSRVLRGAGAVCLLADTHDQAVAIVVGEPELELVILDFQMPDGDVGHLVKRLRAARAALPLIGTSGADRRNEFARRGVSPIPREAMAARRPRASDAAPMTQKSDRRKRRARAANGSEGASKPLVEAAPGVTREEFSAAFDRCFTRVYAYVGRRVSDGASCEGVVSQVLLENLDLLVERGDEQQEVRQLKAASDRLIELESGRSRSTRAIEP